MDEVALQGLISSCAGEINQHWNKKRETIFATCDVLVMVEKRIKKKFPSYWEEFKDLLPFSDSVTKKLLPIGKDRRLRRARIYERLPSCYSTIYEITQLKKPGELEAALKEGQISTRMHREDFIKWRDARRMSHPAALHDGLNGLRVGILGLSPFARLLSSGTLSGPKALKLKQELDALAKRYPLVVEYADCQPLQEARAATIGDLRRRLQRLLVPYNAHLGQGELDLIESAIWQHRAIEDGKTAPYRPEQSNSVENKSHRYSIHDGWDYERLLSEANKQRIITSWTPIEDKDELGEAKCIQRAIWHLQSNDAAKHEKALEKIARANSKHSKFAEWCLQQIAPFGRSGSR
jgi:hypothetical protein